MWIDEFIHVRIAVGTLEGGGLHYFFGTENNQLFIHFLNLLMAFFIGQDDFWFRFPVAFLSSFGVIIIFQLGRTLFNAPIGLMAASFFVASNFHTFWGRVDRAYGLIPVLYMTLCYLFYRYCQHAEGEKKVLKTLWRPATLGFLLMFMVAFLTQIQVFLFFLSAGVFVSGRFLYRFWSEKKQCYTDFFAWGTYGTLFALIIFVTPLLDMVMRPLIDSFLPSYVASLILPRWGVLWDLMHSVDWDKSLQHYLSVTQEDFQYFYWFGYVGILISVWLLNKRGAAFIFSIFTVPFLMMSFILRDPNLGKYMSFYYPSFLIAGAATLYLLGKQLIEYFLPLPSLPIRPICPPAPTNPVFIPYKKYNKKIIQQQKAIQKQRLQQSQIQKVEEEKYHIALRRHQRIKKYQQLGYVAGFVILLWSMAHIKEMKYFITTKDYGNIINPKLSEIYYIPWKEACNYIREHKKDGDIIMSTLPVLPYYLPTHELKTNMVYTFRQRLLEPLSKQFLQRTDTPTDGSPHAYTLQGVKNLYNNNPRGWLLAHYYFDNVFTDERAKDFCIKNMDYHFNQNKTGMIKIFSWDHREPQRFQKTLFEELGKSYETEVSNETYNIDIPKNTFALMESIKISITEQGLNSGEEGIIEINNQRFYIPLPAGRENSPNVEEISFSMDRQYLKEGRNEIRFLYEGNGDIETSKGFVIYALQVIIQKKL